VCICGISVNGQVVLVCVLCSMGVYLCVLTGMRCVRVHAACVCTQHVCVCVCGCVGMVVCMSMCGASVHILYIGKFLSFA